MSDISKGLRFGLSLAVVAAATAMSGSALAQSAPQQPPPTDGGNSNGNSDEIVVTGFRGALAAAIDVKRNATGVVDAIMAEDIADFPDLNLAEAVQRIPGVSIDRDAGEGRSITVRGLSSDFTRTRINGMEAQATTGGTDSSGGANRGRGFDFNVFASDLFNSIKVSKTAAAEVEEGSLGATVDLQTARPFDYKGFTAASSVQLGYNDLAEQTDPRGAFLISNTWFDGKLGALVSAAYSERNSLEEGFSSVRWDNGPSNGGFCSPLGFAPQNPTNSGATGTTTANCATGVPRPANTASNNAAYTTANSALNFHPRLPRYGRLTHEQERLGVTGALQFKPDSDTLISYDLLYSNLDATRKEEFLEAISFSRNAAAGGKTQTTVLDAVANGGQLDYGLFNDVDVRAEARFDELSTQFVQHSLTFERDVSDTLRVKAFLGHAQSDFENPVQTTVTLDRTNTDGYSYDFRPNQNLPLINYGFNVADPANFAFIPSTGVQPRSEIRIRPNGVLTIFQSAQFDVEKDINDSLTLKGGINWKTYDSKSFEMRRADETVVPVLPTGSTVGSISSLLTGYGSNMDLPAGSATSWVTPNIDAVASLFNIYCNCNTGVAGGDFRLTGITNGNARGGNRTIEEDDKAAYLQLDFRSTVLGMPLRGNAGVRQVHTELNALGYSSTAGGTPVTGSNSYDDTLPSLNLALDVTDSFVARFGAAKVIARPQIGNTLAGTNYLVPVTSLSTTGPNFTASIGNVELEPFRANTYDLSFEWYFAEEALLSVAFFYKDIDTYIQILRQDLPYSDLTALNPVAFAPGFCTGVCSSSTLFQLTSAANTDGGPLKGFEISYQQPFTFLPGLLRNVGVQLNYTYVQSEIDYCSNALCTATVTNDLVNLSPEAYNGTLYYEDEAFSARVSLSYRDQYLQNVPGRNNNAIEGKQETLNIDTAATYKIGDHMTLTFEGINLTDEPNHQFVGDGQRESTSVYHHTGRQYYFGLRYKY